MIAVDRVPPVVPAEAEPERGCCGRVFNAVKRGAIKVAEFIKGVFVSIGRFFSQCFISLARALQAPPPRPRGVRWQHLPPMDPLRWEALFGAGAWRVEDRFEEFDPDALVDVPRNIDPLAKLIVPGPLKSAEPPKSAEPLKSAELSDEVRKKLEPFKDLWAKDKNETKSEIEMMRRLVELHQVGLEEEQRKEFDEDYRSGSAIKTFAELAIRAILFTNEKEDLPKMPDFFVWDNKKENLKHKRTVDLVNLRKLFKTLKSTEQIAIIENSSLKPFEKESDVHAVRKYIHALAYDMSQGNLKIQKCYLDLLKEDFPHDWTPPERVPPK
jgi:hypothetical protein